MGATTIGFVICEHAKLQWMGTQNVKPALGGGALIGGAFDGGIFTGGGESTGTFQLKKWMEWIVDGRCELDM